RRRRGRGGEHLASRRRGQRGADLQGDRGPARTALPGPGQHGRGGHRGPAASMLRQLSVDHQSWPLAAPFRISRGVKHSAEVVAIEICQDGIRGRGESVPYARYGETIDSVQRQIRLVAKAVEAGSSRAELARL